MTRFLQTAGFWASLAFIVTMIFMTVSYALAAEYDEMEQSALSNMEERLSGIENEIAFTEPTQAQFNRRTEWYFCVTAIDDNEVKAYAIVYHQEGAKSYQLDRDTLRFSHFCNRNEWFVRKKL